MTFQAKISMSTFDVQASSNTNLKSSKATAPSTRDVEAFSDMMEEKLQEDAGNGDMPSMASLMGQMAHGMLQGSMSSSVSGISSISAPHFSAQEIDAMLNMLVERIAMTDASAHMVTVEVSLADTALQGTTVHLTRSLDGLLAVNVMTNDAASFQTLVGAQLDLKIKLEALDVGSVRVDISHNSQEQERDPQRRSDTYEAYSGDDDGHA